MKYELQYAQMRPALHDQNAQIGERKTEIIEADNLAEAEQKAELFLAGRAKISLHSLHLPSAVLKPNSAFLPPHEMYEL